MYPFTGCIAGQPGRGKSHMALTISEVAPVYLIDTEFRASYLLNKKDFEGRDITLYRAQNWQDVRQAIGDMLDKPKGTLVIDSGSDYSTFAQLEYKKRAQVEKIWPQTNWAEVYDLMDRPIDATKAAGHDVILTARMKPKYVNDSWDGETEVPRLPQNIPYKSDFMIEIEPDGSISVVKNAWADITKWEAMEVSRDTSLPSIIETLQSA